MSVKQSGLWWCLLSAALVAVVPSAGSACHQSITQSNIPDEVSSSIKPPQRAVPATPDRPETVPTPNTVVEDADALTPEQLAEVDSQVSAIIDGGTEPDPAFATDDDVLVTKPEELDDLLGEFPEE